MGSPTTINLCGWVQLDATHHEFGVTDMQRCALIAHDKKRFELLALKLDAHAWKPAMTRAAFGHSIPWLEYRMIMHTLDDYEVRALPAMVHGTKFFNLQGILDAGLNAGRTLCRFNMIPHFDARAEMGQRFDDGKSLVF